MVVAEDMLVVMAEAVLAVMAVVAAYANRKL